MANNSSLWRRRDWTALAGVVWGTTPAQRHESTALLVADGLASWILASSREIGSLPVRTAAMEYPWTEHAETLIPIQTPVSGRSCIQPPRRSLTPVLSGLYYGAVKRMRCCPPSHSTMGRCHSVSRSRVGRAE